MENYVTSSCTIELIELNATIHFIIYATIFRCLSPTMQHSKWAGWVSLLNVPHNDGYKENLVVVKTVKQVLSAIICLCIYMCNPKLNKLDSVLTTSTQINLNKIF